MAIATGSMTQRVVFKQPASSLNNEGGKEKTFTSFWITYAARENYKDFRRVEVPGTAIVGTFDFYVRWCSNSLAITKDYLIENEGKDFTISNIDRNSYVKQFIKFTAKAKE